MNRLVKYYWKRTKRNKLAILGLIYIVILVIVAIFGPYFTVDPNLVNFAEKNIPPLGFSIEQSFYDIESGEYVTFENSGDFKHPLGTDDKGRDLLELSEKGL